jgi:bifunctional enzyme CysN/CysC
MDHDQPLTPGRIYTIKHTTRTVRAKIVELRYHLDIRTLHRDEAATGLRVNEIGRISLRTTSPLLFDEYRRNRTTGSFILIDEATNDTVAAGMLLAPTAELSA